MQLRNIFTSPNYYAVCESDRSENWVIFVVVGGIAMYEVIVELTADEVSTFNRDGHLDDLARQIAKNADAFAPRTLKPIDSKDKITFVTHLSPT
ncbi:MAG: hypothetical protein HQL49_11725 [Gammaproteobacteria bacterium]|nr:hypothetical protein [Gammaproteobacteria bacterium]